MNSIRCFIALELPLTVQRHLAGIISRLKTSKADVRWVDPRNTHLTLKFLGEISPEQAKRAGEFLAAQSGRHGAINCSTSQIGVFPGWSRPQVVWLGLEEGVQKISDLQKTLEGGLAGCGFARDPKTFKPHLTMGRVRSQFNIEALAEKIRASEMEEIGFSLGELALIKSTLAPGGPVYQALETIKLA